MCGIAGIYNYASNQAVDGKILNKMMDAMHHRGPDDAGIFVKNNLGMAMRRLSVIDLQTGGQPMSSDDGRIQLTFNGEIYNYQELRKELINFGFKFHTHSDTEVILRLYEKMGLEFLQKLRGMFALALWDERHDRILLARDRMGKKPLYYSNLGGRLVWASEIRALIQDPQIPRGIDPQAVDLFLGLQYIPSPWSIYKSVRKIPPAHYLLLEKGQLRSERYWELSPQKIPFPYSLEETKEMIREKIRESVRLRMVSDVPLGAFLSGGLDSTIVVGLMSQLSKQPIKTFSIGFDEKEYSELSYAREAAKFFKTDHTEFIVKPNVADILPVLAQQYGEPFGDSSALPTYFLARETRKHVTVALTGDGGDENFGGYNRYAAMKWLAQLDRLPFWMRKSFSPLGYLLPRRGRRFFQDFLPAGNPARYLDLIGIFNRKQKEELYTPEFKQQLATESQNLANSLNPPVISKSHYRESILFESLFSQALNRDSINQLTVVDFATYLPDCLMPKVDIATMAHSLEARSPFLDHELIELTSQIPGEWKLHGLFSQKWILKETFKNEIPASILNRPKMGFGLPIDAWFRGPLKEFFGDQMLSTHSLNLPCFQKSVLEKLFSDHLANRRNHGYRLWCLLVLELWRGIDPPLR